MTLMMQFCGCLFGCWLLNAAAEEKIVFNQKLFLSGAQVAAAEAKKRVVQEQKLSQSPFQDISVSGIKERWLHYDAFVYQAQKTSLWINGQLIEHRTKIEGIDIDPSTVRASGKMNFYHRGHLVNLQPGQKYCLTDGRQIEAYQR